MVFNMEESFDLEVARPATKPVMEVAENAADIWQLEDTEDMEHELTDLEEKYKFMTVEKFRKLSKKEQQELLHGAVWCECSATSTFGLGLFDRRFGGWSQMELLLIDFIDANSLGVALWCYFKHVFKMVNRC